MSSLSKLKWTPFPFFVAQLLSPSVVTHVALAAFTPSSVVSRPRNRRGGLRRAYILCLDPAASRPSGQS